MKKLFVYALAVGMFTACSQDETIGMQSPMQISFANAFVGNTTRAAADPSTTTESISAFDVWAFMDEPKGKVFVDENVKKENRVWTYTNTQYWTPGHTYYFAALAPMDSPNIEYNPEDGSVGTLGLGKITFTNQKGTEDLLYAATTKTTPEVITQSPGDVQLQFSHLLSKVKFSFENGFKNDNAYITITNIKMTAPQKATINLNTDNWWLTNTNGNGWNLNNNVNDVTLDFGHMERERVVRNGKSESQYERFTFPATGSREYVVTFDVELFMGDVSAYKSSLKTVIKNAELKMGMAYDFHAIINADNIVPGDGEDDKLYPIEFTATVKEWDNGNGYNGGAIVTE